jgi:transformation/transcription domain-associated protein
VALKALVATDLKRSFLLNADDFLNEQFLLGKTQQLTLRPQAFSVMIEFAHQVKDMLTSTQLTKIVHIFCVNIHDPALPLAVQTTSVRLLLTLVERIVQIQMVHDQTTHQSCLKFICFMCCRRIWTSPITC